MSNFLKAIQNRLRYSTSKGVLNTEQLFDISLAELSQAIKASYKLLGDNQIGDELSFLGNTTTSVANKTEQLRFDVMKEVYQLRKAEIEQSQVLSNKRKEEQELLELLANIESKEKQSLTKDEILAKLAELNKA